MGEDLGARVVREVFDGLLIVGREPLQERTGEHDDVAAPQTKRWHVEMHHVEAVEEVLAEAPLANLGRQVSIRRCDDAYVDRDRVASADALEGSLLQDAQELRLDERRDLSDLVEEERSADRLLESTDAPLVGAGEGALLVPEHLALEERLRDRRAVKRYEWHLRTRAERVNGPRELALAGAALSGDENGGAGGRDLARDAIDLLHGGARSDEAL